MTGRLRSVEDFERGRGGNAGRSERELLSDVLRSSFGLTSLGGGDSALGLLLFKLSIFDTEMRELLPRAGIASAKPSGCGVGLKCDGEWNGLVGLCVGEEGVTLGLVVPLLFMFCGLGDPVLLSG